MSTSISDALCKVLRYMHNRGQIRTQNCISNEKRYNRIGQLLDAPAMHMPSIIGAIKVADCTLRWCLYQDVLKQYIAR